MAFVVKVTGYDPAAGIEKDRLFSMGEGIAFTDAPYAVGALTGWDSPSQRVDIKADGMVGITGDRGRLVLQNMPNTVWEEAGLDVLATWIWQNRPAEIFWVEGRLWASRQKIAIGTLEQPISDFNSLDFELRDPRAALDTPLQPSVFAGTNVGPAGVEGNENLKGKPKPIVLGLVSNVSPPLVNESLLIYQVADNQVSVICVRDGSVPLGIGVVRGTLASLQGNPPSPGTYDLFRSAQGTYIRVGSTPIYRITVDADEASNENNQSHANMWARLRARIGTPTDATSVQVANAIDVNGAGFYWDAPVTQAAALNELLGSFSGYEVLGLDGIWRIKKLVIPSGTPKFDLRQLTPTSRMKVSSRAIIDITKIRPAYAPAGAPPYKITVQWGRNYTVMNDSDFAGGAIERLKQKFSTEFRSAFAINTAIWNPTTKTGPWTNAPEITVQTGYQPGSDGLSSPGAQQEAERLLALLGPLRPHYQVSIAFKPGDAVQNGDTMKLTHPRFNLSNGALFTVLQAGFTLRDRVGRIAMVLGLQV